MFVKRIIAILMIFVLLCHPGAVHAIEPSTSLSAIGTIKQGETFKIQGITRLQEVIIVLLRPNQTIMEMDQLTEEQLLKGKSVTLPANASVGIYTVKAGTGSDSATVTFEVLPGGGTNPGPDPNPNPDPEPEPVLDLAAIAATVKPGDNVTVKGVTNQELLAFRLTGPDGNLLTEQTITKAEFERGYDYRITGAMPLGMYTLRVGNELITKQATFIVIKRSSGNSGRGQISPEASPQPADSGNSPNLPQPVVKDGFIELELRHEGMPDAEGKVKLAVAQEVIDQALAQLKEGTEPAKWIFSIPAVDGAKAYELSLPASMITEGMKGYTIELKTEFATLTVPGNMLTRNETTQAAYASFTVAQAALKTLPEPVMSAIGNRPAVDLSVAIDGNPTSWSNPKAPIFVSLPYQPSAAELNNPEAITVWYIDPTGGFVPVTSGKYDAANGNVTFKVNHFSQYAVTYVTKTFADLSDYPWARKQIETLASKGIVTGTSEHNFTPAAPVKRSDFILLLVRTLELYAGFETNFDDVSRDAYYYQAAGMARSLGIAEGSGDNRFLPDKEISRQEMMTLTARALQITGKLKPSDGTAAAELAKFTDAADVADYAVPSIAQLIKLGIIEGNNGMLDPLGSAGRAETAVMLYRIYNQ